MTKESIIQKTYKGFIWSALEEISGQIAHIIIGIILARLLEPSTYGIIGMLSIFMAISNSIIDSGFGKAWIQNKNRTQVDYSTVFYINITIALIAYSILFLFAPIIANFYKMPILTIVTRVISIKLLFCSLQLVQTTKLIIELNFKVLLKVRLFTTIVSGFVGISLAYYGFGVWSLISQSLMSSFLDTILIWSISKWHPSICFSKASFRKLFGFGSKLLITGLYGPIFSNLSSLIIGKFYSATSLGLYSRAKTLVSPPFTVLTSIISRVTFPVLSSIQNEDERLANTYRILIKQTYFLVFPLMFGIIICAPLFTEIILTHKWIECIPYMRVSCIGLTFYPICAYNINLLLVKGRSNIHLRLDIIKKVFSILIIIFSSFFGVLAICYSSIISSIFSWILTAYYSGKLMNLTLKTQIFDITPSFVQAVIMGCLIYLIKFIPINSIIILILQIFFGVVIYFLLSLFFNKECLYNITRLIFHKTHENN